MEEMLSENSQSTALPSHSQPGRVTFLQSGSNRILEVIKTVNINHLKDRSRLVVLLSPLE